MKDLSAGETVGGLSAPTLERQGDAESRDDYPCPECGYEGPHDWFAPNEAECGDCHCEFSR